MVLWCVLGFGTALILALTIINGVKSGYGMDNILFRFGVFLILFTVIVLIVQTFLTGERVYIPGKSYTFISFSKAIPTLLFTLAGAVCVFAAMKLDIRPKKD